MTVAMAGFGIGACLWWVYFERLTGQKLPRAAVPVVTFAYAHLPLLAALMYVASGVSLLVRSEGALTGSAGAWALCLGVATFLAALNTAHAQLVAAPVRPVFRGRWLAVVAMLVIPWLTRTPITVTAVTLAVLVALVAFEAATCGPMEQADRSRAAS